MICAICHVDKPEDEFYTFNRVRSVGHYKKCKVCYNPKRTLKPKGFDKLPLDVQENIRLMFSDRKNKVKDIARAFNINYSTLNYWVTKGKIC